MPPYKQQVINVRLTSAVIDQFRAYRKRYNTTYQAAKASGCFDHKKLARYLTPGKGRRSQYALVDHYLVVCQAKGSLKKTAGIKSVIWQVSHRQEVLGISFAEYFDKLLEDYAKCYACYGTIQGTTREGIIINRVAKSLGKPLKTNDKSISSILRKDLPGIPFQLALCMAEGVRREDIRDYPEMFEYDGKQVTSEAVLKHIGLEEVVDFDEIAPPVSGRRGRRPETPPDEKRTVFDYEDGSIEGVDPNKVTDIIERQGGVEDMTEEVEDEVYATGDPAFDGWNKKWHGVEDLERALHGGLHQNRRKRE